MQGSTPGPVVDMPNGHLPNGPHSMPSTGMSIPVSSIPSQPGSYIYAVVHADPSVASHHPSLPSGVYSSYPPTDTSYSTPSTVSMVMVNQPGVPPYYIPQPAPVPLDAQPQASTLEEGRRVLDGPIAERAPRRPKLGSNVEASCPLVGALHRGHEIPDLMPVNSLKFTAKVHIAVMMVDVELETEAAAHLGKAHRLEVYCPKTPHTTFTAVKVENLTKAMVATSVIVPIDEMNTSAVPYRPPFATYDDPNAGPDRDDPNLFVFEIPTQFHFKAGHKLKLTMSYFEPLEFWDGSYLARLPTTIPGRCLPDRQALQDILQVRMSVDIGLPLDVELECNQPVVELEAADNGVQRVRLDDKAQPSNMDFTLQYKVWGANINAACYVQQPIFVGEDGKVTGGLTAAAPAVMEEQATRRPPLLQHDSRLDHLPTFCVTVAPESPEHASAFPRAVVFVLDRSGSMQGNPLEYALQAVLVGLGLLGPEDVFSACCFDHEQFWWSEELQPATKENIADCEAWAKANFTAKGLTDIKGPLCKALDKLDGVSQLPFIFLLTDGCVADERNICREVEERLTSSEARGPYRPRINTFAIGPFANHFFLKHLALTTRGLFDVAFRPNSIQVQMERMLSAAARPILSDVTVQVPGLEDGLQVAVLPQPVPDLFCGQPLLVVGKYDGQWPDQVVLHGRTPHQQSEWSQEVNSTKVENLPLDKIWAKAYLDKEAATAWRHDDKAACLRVKSTSMSSGVPYPPYTHMVGIACTPERYDELQADLRANKRQKVIKYAVAGAAGIALVSGAAALLSFGDVGATMGNMIPFDAFGGDCCQCCGECCGGLLGGGCVLS